MPDTSTPFVQQLVASLARRTPGLGEAPPAVPAEPLRPEDRPDFEQVLDRALVRTPPPEPLTGEQVRAMALGASAAIAATAAAEYADYVGVRDAAAAGPVEVASTGAEGAGAITVIAILAPVLSGTAAVVFLGVGYGLRFADAGRKFARQLTNSGWLFLALTALAVVVGAVGLLLTALRQPAPSVAAARAAWQEALLERGVEPFLREVYQVRAAAEPGGPARPPSGTG